MTQRAGESIIAGRAVRRVQLPRRKLWAAAVDCRDATSSGRGKRGIQTPRSPSIGKNKGGAAARLVGGKAVRADSGAATLREQHVPGDHDWLLAFQSRILIAV
jgi:hypothetical protein